MDLFSLAVLVGAVLAFFAGVAIVVANLAGATFGRAGISRSLHSIDAVYGATADENGVRGGTVFGNRIAQLGRAATPRVVLTGIRRRLDYAGNPPYWTVDRIFELKGLGLIVVGVLGVVFGV